MQNRQIRHVESRMFRSLYRGRVRLVTKTTWFLNNGSKKCELVLTDATARNIIKRWSWIEGA